MLVLPAKIGARPTARRVALPAACLLALLVGGQTMAAAQGAAAEPKIDTGDTALMLVSTAFVMFMTPGLALFYGGMVRAKRAEHADAELCRARHRHAGLGAVGLLARLRA